MSWFHRYRVEIVSGIFIGIYILLLLFVVRFYINELITPSNDYLPGNIPLKEHNSDLPQQTDQAEPSIRTSIPFDSSKTEGYHKVQASYYIIVGSYKNIMQAQQRADKIKIDFNTNTIILPATKEGYFRISCGKCSTLEQANAQINSIRTNINSEAWILSVEK